MKSLHSTFIKVLALFAITVLNAHAEIKLDSSMPQKRSIQVIKPMQEITIWPYAERMSYNFEYDDAMPSEFRSSLAGGQNKNSVFAWLINEQRYLSNVVSYAIDNDPIEGCENYPPIGSRHNLLGPQCNWINQGHLVCHLFMMTEKGHIAGIGRIKIGRDENLIYGKPYCNDVKGISAPQDLADTMLITLSYIDSAATPNPRKASEEFRMTVLLRFKQEPDGKLNITQDDQCLPNPNRIASITQARNVLKTNGCMK